MWNPKTTSLRYVLYAVNHGKSTFKIYIQFKKMSIFSIVSSKFLHFIFLISACILSQSSNLYCQEFGCGVVPTSKDDSIYSHYAVAYRDLNYNNETRFVTNIPVIYICSRNDNAQYSNPNINSVIVANNILTSLDLINDIFQEIDIQFFQLGDVHYIDNSEVENFIFFDLTKLVYQPNTLCVVVPGQYTGRPIGAFPWAIPINQNNIVRLNPGHLDVVNNSFAFPHEMGHVFGLYHTWDLKVDENGLRELVIRNFDDSKQHKTPNCNDAGDRLCDTYADCAVGLAFPGCETTSKLCNITNSDFPYSKNIGSYIDQNGDVLINNEEREKNLMSYYWCVDHLTNQQYNIVNETNKNQRKDQLNAIEINVSDYVEFEGTDKKLKNIIVKLIFPEVNSLLNYSQDFTNTTGKFQFAKLHNIVRAHLKTTTEKIYSPAANEYDFIPHEHKHWKDSIDIFDVIAVQKYIGYPGSQFGQGTLANGYKILAADVNDDGIINELDFIKLQQLIAGSISTFQPFTQPWRFVPEFISQGNFGFANWPFDRTIQGAFIPKADYTKPEYEFTINNGLNGKAGFDGVKIGNTTHTPDFTEHPGTQKINITSDILLYADVSYKVKLAVDASGFSALQHGVHVKNGIVENNNVNTNTSIPYLDSISFNYNSEENYMNLVWSDLSNVYDTMMLYEFVFTPTITAPSLDSFFNIEDQTIPAYIVDSIGGVISGNFTLTIMDLDTSELRSTNETNTTGAMRMAVYPNPAMDKIYVILESGRGEAGKELAYDIQIMSSNSLVSMRKNGVMNANNETIELDVSALPNGIWYVQVSGLDNTITKSVVIQH